MNNISHSTFVEKWCVVDSKRIFGGKEKRIIIAIFKRIVTTGALDLDFGGGHIVTVGIGQAALTIAPPKLKPLLLILLNPRYFILETFISGDWHCVRGTLLDILFFFENLSRNRTLAALNVFYKLSLKTHFYKQYIAPRRETRKTVGHYNNNPHFFEILLGIPPIYSCAYFANSDVSLQDAQNRKMQLVMDRVGIQQNTKGNLLDIGSGWGAVANFIFENSELNVDGISISQSQVNFSNERYALEHKDRALTFACRDFIGLEYVKPKFYDFIVSIGMLEHVGKTQYPSLFRVVFNLLKPKGVAVFHSIVKHHDERSNSWIDEYVFPGGYIPKISEVVNASEKTGLKCEGVFIIDGANYVITLQKWLDNFIRNDAIISEIFSENGHLQGAKLRKEMRIWYAYLNAIQILFLRPQKKVDVAHFILRRPV